MNFKVTIIVPVYNGESTLANLLDDLKKQLFDNYEVIFVNDGSDDQTLSILNGFAQESSIHVKVLSQPNAGVSSARNLGLKAARGEYICFMDADDRISSYYLSTLYDGISINEADLAIAKYSIDGLSYGPIDAQWTSVDTLSLLRWYLYAPQKNIGIYTLLVKRSLLLEHQLVFQESYDYGEDSHYMWRLFAAAKTIVQTDAVIYHYQFHPSSATAEFNKRWLHSYELKKMLITFFDQKIPEFALEYKKYGPAHTMRAIVLHAAKALDWKDFKRLIKNHPVQESMLQLKDFPDGKVRFTSALFRLSPYLFFLFLHTFRKHLLSRA